MSCVGTFWTFYFCVECIKAPPDRVVPRDTATQINVSVNHMNTSMLARSLARFKVEKGQQFTHTSIGKPKASYFVPVEAEDEFFGLYREAFGTADEKLHLTEKHRDIGPVLIDLDFRHKLDADAADPPERRYTAQHVDRILEIYMRCIGEYVDLELVSARAYVLEKPAPRVEKGKIKDGIHVVIPDIITTPALQLMLREKALPELAAVFADIGIENSAADCLDEAVIQRNNWQMYGSCKPDGQTYEVTRVLRWDGAAMAPCEPAESRADYIELLSIRNKYVETDVIPGREEDIAAWTRKNTRRAPAPPTIPSGNNAFFNTDVGVDVVRNQTKDMDLVLRLIGVLNPARADAYDTWIRVGWCMRNIDYRLLEQWIAFSRGSAKFVEGECEELWDKMRVNGGLGIATLKMWASRDSPEVYKEAVREDVFGLIQKAYTGTHYDVACVIYAMYGNEFVCASAKNKFWYEFKSHRWHPCEEGMSLSQRISVQVVQEFAHVSSVFNQRAANTTDDSQQKTYIEVSQKLCRVALNLKNTTFKKNVMQECMGMFYVAKFAEKLDSRCHLIGFENGVYDLETMTFREGLPDDYVSYSTNISYIPLNTEHSAHADLLTYFEQVFPVAAVREYVITHLASCLNGNVKEERFHIWTGTGSNSKSIVVSLFEKCFGDYCCKLPISLLTNKRAASNAACSEIARTKGRRFAVLQEPSENEKFNVGLMKELSGGDKIMARSLYQEPFEFLPQMKMVLTCNSLPEVPSSDDGTWRRIRLVEFLSKFTDKPEPGREYQFPIDRDLTAKMEGWKETFMAMLIEIYKKYRVDGLVEPDEVLKATREYQRNNDYISEFIECCATPTENAFVTINETYQLFKQWNKDSNPDTRVHSRKDFTRLVCKVWGKEQRGRGGSQGWYGHKIAYDPFEQGDGGMGGGSGGCDV